MADNINIRVSKQVRDRLRRESMRQRRDMGPALDVMLDLAWATWGEPPELGPEDMTKWAKGGRPRTAPEAEGGDAGGAAA